MVATPEDRGPYVAPSRTRDNVSPAATSACRDTAAATRPAAPSCGHAASSTRATALVSAAPVRFIRPACYRGARARGLAVMTSLSHSEGRRFESGRAHSFARATPRGRYHRTVKCTNHWIAVRCPARDTG